MSGDAHDGLPHERFPMNAFPITDQILDRLVDGELAGEEYRDVVARLELEPDGWRRCALAFLEAQAWGRDIVAPAREVRPAKITPSEAKPAAASDTNWSALLLAMAASFLLAFGLGWGIGGRGGDANPGGPPTTANIAELPAVKPVAKPPDDPIDPPGERPTPVAHRQEPNQGEITLLLEDAAGKQSEMQLPVVEVNSADDIARSLTTSALPARIREAIERSGHRVVRQQQVIPVQLQDGRQLMMPVEEVRVVPIGGPYQ